MSNWKTRNKTMQNFHHISAFLVYPTFSAKIESFTRCISTLLVAMYNSVGHTITEKSAKNGCHAHPGSTVVQKCFRRLTTVSVTNDKYKFSHRRVSIIPIHKGGPSDDPSNYRPISILPLVSKVIEKHVTKHLFAYLNKCKLLQEAQSGFRKHHSCQTARIKLIND